MIITNILKTINLEEQLDLFQREIGGDEVRNKDLKMVRYFSGIETS